MTDYDLIVIGGGPGGYNAAALAGSNGMRVLLVEREHLGGTCLNRGCIPTKTLLRSAKALAEARHASQFGVLFDGEPRLDFAHVIHRKDDVVTTLRNGVTGMMARAKVRVLAASAEVLDRETVRVDGETYRARNLLIATGAAVVRPIIPDAEHIRTTTEMLRAESLPESLVILGADPVALGFASVFSTFGSQVTIVTAAQEVAPDIDAEIAAKLRAALAQVTFRLGADVAEVNAHGVRLGDGSVIAGLVMATGRRQPNVEALAALPLDIVNGGILTDEYMRTNVPGVYAVGDVTGRAMWAHVALREGEVAVRHMLGLPDRMRYDYIPTPVYTIPEAASVGLTEQAASDKAVPVRIVRRMLSANGRALADGDTRGIVKLIIHAESDVILGVHWLGGPATEAVFGVAAMLEDEFRAVDWREVVFAHPTISESLREAAL